MLLIATSHSGKRGRSGLKRPFKKIRDKLNQINLLKVPSIKLHAPQAISGTAAMLAAVLFSASPMAAEARAQNFVCSSVGGVPTTTASMADGRSVPVIRWTSSAFDGAGWTPERRCQEVSSRFSTYHRGRLNYITTGRINGLPVICTAASNGGPCDGLLYTLKPGQNATATLRNLFDVRYKARGTLNETSGRLYLNMNELLGASSTAAQSSGAGSTAELPAERLF